MTEPELTFRIDAREATVAVIGLVLILDMCAVLLVAGLSLAGILSTSNAVMSTGFLALASLVFCFSMWLRRRGTALITPRHLKVRTTGGSQSYAFTDIDNVRVQGRDQVWLPDRLLWRAFGMKRSSQLVELHLRRSLRIALVPFQFGTDIIGVPGGFARIVRFFPEEPEAFANAVADRLAHKAH